MKPIFETCQPRPQGLAPTLFARLQASTSHGVVAKALLRGRPVDNSTGVAYSLALARLLRHERLNAQGERRHTSGQARRQADALLDFDDQTVVIKAEFGAPAKTDADKRFPPDQRAMVGGLPLRLAVAEGYPERPADRPESDTDSNLATATDLTISHRYQGDEPGESVGTVAPLAAPAAGPLPHNASLNVAGRLDANEAEVEEAGDPERTEKTTSNVTAKSGRTVEV